MCVPKCESVCVYLCVCVSLRNRFPKHVNYDDETFTGDLMGPEEVQRINFILKNMSSETFGTKPPPTSGIAASFRN